MSEESPFARVLMDRGLGDFVSEVEMPSDAVDDWRVRHAALGFAVDFCRYPAANPSLVVRAANDFHAFLMGAKGSHQYEPTDAQIEDMAIAIIAGHLDASYSEARDVLGELDEVVRGAWLRAARVVFGHAEYSALVRSHELQDAPTGP